MIAPLFLKYMFAHISSPFVLRPAPTRPSQACHRLTRGSWSLLLLAVVCGPHSSSSMGRRTSWASRGPCLRPHTSCLTFPTPAAVCILHSAFVEGPLPRVPTLLQRANLLCSCLLCRGFTQKQLPERVSLYLRLTPSVPLHTFALLSFSRWHSQ